MMPQKQYRHLSPKVVQCFQGAVLEMVLLVLVVLEDYNMTRGTILRKKDTVSWFPSPSSGHKAFRNDKKVL